MTHASTNLFREKNLGRNSNRVPKKDDATTEDKHSSHLFSEPVAQCPPDIAEVDPSTMMTYSEAGCHCMMVVTGTSLKLEY